MKLSPFLFVSLLGIFLSIWALSPILELSRALLFGLGLSISIGAIFEEISRQSPKVNDKTTS